MAEQILVDADTRAGKYTQLFPQLEALIGAETDPVANMANMAAALKSALGFFWVGFYIVKNNELVLGPFQGPVACTRIVKGKGVCGTAWAKNKTVIVDNVEKFPGHIACNSESKSEIVVPLRNKSGEVFGVLDVDSDKLSDFDTTDELWLEKICSLLSTQSPEAI